jgi:hypothetical protein
MIPDDGDIVRGLGFVSMYSARVEDDIDNLLCVTAPIEPFDEKKQRWPISKKLEHAAKLVESLGSSELDELPDALRYGLSLFERRNEIIHGRIYASFEKTDFLKSGRANVSTRAISSAELYELANEFFNYRGHLIGPKLFRFPRAVNRVLQSAT